MTLEQEQRDAVLAEAATWIGTKHHNGARIKGVGVDCGQFPIAVYTACGLMADPKPERYPHDFHLHRDREWYKELADAAGKRIDGNPKPGDFALYKIGRIYSHGAIVVKWPQIIHAYIGVGVIYDLGNQGHLTDRDVIFYTLWG